MMYDKSDKLYDSISATFSFTLPAELSNKKSEVLLRK